MKRNDGISNCRSILSPLLYNLYFERIYRTPPRQGHFLHRWHTYVRGPSDIYGLQVTINQPFRHCPWEIPATILLANNHLQIVSSDQVITSRYTLFVLII